MPGAVVYFTAIMMTAILSLGRRSVRLPAVSVAAIALAIFSPLTLAQSKPVGVKAHARAGATPWWNKGIVPINRESYYHAIECGKQGGADPPCVFYDTGLCENDDFAISMYSPYKQVAYEVWLAVRKKQPPPMPNYVAAQQTRVTLGLTAVKGSKNVLTDLVVKRGGKMWPAFDRSLSGGGGRFTFDTTAFAAAGTLTLEMVGTDRTIACTIAQSVLKQLR